jgi:hypothetical protein
MRVKRRLAGSVLFIFARERGGAEDGDPAPRRRPPAADAKERA